MKVVRTDRLSLEQLKRYAAAFDEMSDETGARYSAATFVEWLRLETSTLPRREPRRVARQPPLLASGSSA
jgi:hypothetical protein